MSFKIYTKTGDTGKTALIGGTRIPKSHIRIEAYGTVDELNSFLGMVSDQIDLADCREIIKEIQDRLFTVGSSLATDPDKDLKMRLPDLHDADIEYLENHIDTMQAQLPELKSFILPGGNIASSTCHVARCVCRRAERICVHMDFENEFVAPLVIMYLNRLSDFLFVMSRYIAHKNGATDMEWHPRLS
jgi:cob(I)alamin adenosyltransferase